MTEHVIDTIPTETADEAREALNADLISRGYSRRSLGRIAALMTGGIAAVGMAPEALAQQSAKAVAGAVRIGSNECWTGPLPAGAEAAMLIVAKGNWYEPTNEHQQLFDAVSKVEGVPVERILAWPGSSDPLARVPVTFASPKRGIVTADATYESIWRTGAWIGAKMTKVPLTADYRHDVKAMLKADPNAGVYYICSPNNPTGTITPIEDIEWLAQNMPKDAVLLVDEAYVHWSDTPRAAPLAVKYDNVVVMRTFSKLFGMAGMRLGLTFASPALHEKMMRYDGRQVSNMLPMTAVACGAASVPLAGAIKDRAAQMVAAREYAIAHVKKRGLNVVPGSHANMFMVEWKGKTPKEMQAALLEQGVQIGRSWVAMPTYSRVTVGSMEDMQKFCLALDKVMTA